MRFGQTNPMRTARGKLGIGLALILFGAVAILAAPNLSDKLICSLVVLAGGGFVALGIRQDRADKEAFREQGELREADKTAREERNEKR